MNNKKRPYTPHTPHGFTCIHFPLHYLATKIFRILYCMSLRHIIPNLFGDNNNEVERNQV